MSDMRTAIENAIRWHYCNARACPDTARAGLPVSIMAELESCVGPESVKRLKVEGDEMGADCIELRRLGDQLAAGGPILPDYRSFLPSLPASSKVVVERQDAIDPDTKLAVGMKLTIMVVFPDPNA